MYANFKFDITARDEGTKARCGVLHTPHGVLETPNFIFCGTKAALKGVTTQQAKDAGAQIILANTYHLLLNPGADIVAQNGGLHKMMGWSGPMFTDSGGFQIFSLGHGGVAAEIKGRNRSAQPKTLRKINENGAIFRSYLDGRYHELTPELSIDVQRKLGADLIVVLDECTPFHSDKKYTAKSMRRSHRWELRSLEEFKRGDDGRQALYGIVQGGIYPDLRQESAQFVAESDFFGQAVGGSLGGDKVQMQEIVSMTCEYLNPNRPTHLLGIGGLTDIWNGVEHGIDTFDCVHPTRLARHGGALINPMHNDGKEHINLKNSRYKDDFTPLNPDGSEYSAQFTKSYIHYLFKANEHLAGTLLTIHNMAFMTNLARIIRESIQEGTLQQVKKEWVN
jgi:queuine tRNA-ribosyltransferase